jgi:hypothetical protein
MTDTARQHVKETSTVARWRLIDAALVSAHHLPARWGEIEQTGSDDPATAAQRIVASRPPDPLAAENARLRAALKHALSLWEWHCTDSPQRAWLDAARAALGEGGT